MTQNEIYTPLADARDEICRRWADRDLRRKVEEFLGGVPPGVNGEPRSFLCRTVHSPNREFHRFIELAKASGLSPAPMEYLDDRFCSVNSDKLGLVRMTFCRDRNCHGKPLFHRRMITGGDINGKPITSIKTLWGENLVNFHHRILLTTFPSIAPENESLWLRTKGPTPKEFYPALLARSICHGILFESYLETRYELAFIRDIVLPAFEAVCSLFDMKPIVVRLLPEESANDPSWSWYHEQTERFVDM